MNQLFFSLSQFFFSFPIEGATIVKSLCVLSVHSFAFLLYIREIKMKMYHVSLHLVFF